MEFIESIEFFEFIESMSGLGTREQRLEKEGFYAVS